MGSPQVNNSDALIKALVVTGERKIEVEAFEATEHQHHTAFAESTTLLDNERQIEMTDALYSDDQSDTEHSGSINSTSPNQNQYQQNCDSVIEADSEASQQVTADDQNCELVCQSGTSNSINCSSGTVKARTAHKRLRLARSWCLWFALVFYNFDIKLFYNFCGHFSQAVRVRLCAA